MRFLESNPIPSRSPLFSASHQGLTTVMQINVGFALDVPADGVRKRRRSISHCVTQWLVGLAPWFRSRGSKERWFL